MTGRDPLAEWGPDDAPHWDMIHTAGFMEGANERLDALRPLIAAAEELAAGVLGYKHGPGEWLVLEDLALARQVRDLTTPKGDPS